VKDEKRSTKFIKEEFLKENRKRRNIQILNNFVDVY